MDFFLDGGEDVDDEELLKELALLDPSGSAGPRKTATKVHKPAEDSDADFNDEDDLLAELSQLMGEDAPHSSKTHHQKPVQTAHVVKKLPVSESAVRVEQQIGQELEEDGEDEEPGEEEERELAELMGSSSAAAQPPTSTAAAASDAQAKPAPSARRDAARKLIQRRLFAFTENGMAAKDDGDLEYATECAEKVMLFQEALKICEDDEEEELTEEDLAQIPSTPPPYQRKNAPKKELTLDEELVARIKKFESLVRAFTEKNEPSRARMNTRLMNQLKEALVRSRKGLPIQPETLPVPPGFEKLPASLPTKPPARRPAAAEVPAAAAEPPKDAPLTVAEQKKILVDKQLQFKQHALKAKKNGDLPAAAKFLKASKELEREIARLSVDVRPVPGPSQSRGAVDLPEIVSASSVSPASLLIPDLKKQLDHAVRMRNKFLAVKDAKIAEFYESLVRKVKSELERCILTARSTDAPLPFKVAQLNLPTLEVNPGIPVDVLELKIKSVQSLKLPEGWKPTDAATFVSYEFPFPHESHQKGKTSIKYGSEDAEFEEAFQLSINRRSRQLQRVLCRYPLKLLVWQKGGFLRSDKPCGEADVVLDALDERASFSDTRDLLLGRRKTGGTVSFEVRLQRPLDEKKMRGTTPFAWTTLLAHN